MDELLTTQEAADRLAVGPTTIKRWADEGRIDVVRTLGGHRRYTLASVLRVQRAEAGLEASAPLHERLATMDPAAIDALAVGVVGFDDAGRIVLYNTFESEFAGFTKDQALGRHLFGELAPCMNNRLIYGRVLDGISQGDLDFSIDYAFTYRMKARAVHLRFYRHATTGTNWLLVTPRPAAGAEPESSAK